MVNGVEKRDDDNGSDDDDDDNEDDAQISYSTVLIKHFLKN